MVRISTDRAPLAVVEIHGEYTMDDVDQVMGFIAGQIERQQTFALLISPRKSSIPSVPTLRHIAKSVAKLEEGIARHCACFAMHLESAALRGAVKFLQTLRASGAPQQVFPTFEEAERWALNQLAAAGATVTR